MLSRLLGLAALACAFALPLGSCSTPIGKAFSSVTGAISTISTATVSTKVAGSIVATYNAAEDLAQDYLDRPLCTAGQTTLANACRQPGPSATLNLAMDKGDAAVDAIDDAIAAAKAKGTGVGVASTLYTAVQDAITHVKQATPQ